MNVQYRRWVCGVITSIFVTTCAFAQSNNQIDHDKNKDVIFASIEDASKNAQCSQAPSTDAQNCLCQILKSYLDPEEYDLGLIGLIALVVSDHMLLYSDIPIREFTPDEDLLISNKKLFMSYVKLSNEDRAKNFKRHKSLNDYLKNFSNVEIQQAEKMKLSTVKFTWKNGVKSFDISTNLKNFQLMMKDLGRIPASHHATYFEAFQKEGLEFLKPSTAEMYASKIVRFYGKLDAKKAVKMRIKVGGYILGIIGLGLLSYDHFMGHHQHKPDTVVNLDSEELMSMIENDYPAFEMYFLDPNPMLAKSLKNYFQSMPEAWTTYNQLVTQFGAQE